MEYETHKEDYVIVLDFLPNGYPFEFRPLKTPIIQALGRDYLSLLELAAKKDVVIIPGQEVYIGEGKRDHVHHILGRLESKKMTVTARGELDSTLAKFVERNESKFVAFFNSAQPMTMRMHQLELLPGVGKKHMWEILEARRDKPFTTLEDMRSRVKLMPDPKKTIVRRLLLEIFGEEKHRLFVDSPIFDALK